jgi:hypothetical protein
MHMKKLGTYTFGLLLLLSLSVSFSGCKKYLDINSDPSNPDNVEAALWLAPILSKMAVDVGFDGRYLGCYDNFFHYYAGSSNADLYGYYPANDAMGQIWRMVYFDMGLNLSRMIENGMQAQQWDYVGVGYALRAWGWLTATDYHGPIIIKEAFVEDPNKSEYDYDDQSYAYQTVFALCDSALAYLNRTDGGVSQTNLARGDLVYKGDRTKWIKFVYGLKARAMQTLSNKTTQYYNPDSVIAWVNQSFTSNADNMLVPFNGNSSADANFLGPTRNNFSIYRQSQFIVNLMNGTVFGQSDPRMPVMLVTDAAGVYRGADAVLGDTARSVTSRALLNPYGLSRSPQHGDPGKYVFSEGPFPIMTYAELQFCKAEAAYKKGDMATALAAYQNGIKAHIQFCGLKLTDPAVVSYLGNPQVIPTDPSQLTLSMIMCQKFIALWGFGFVEVWNDLRKYHYTDNDPKTGQQVFTGFTLPLPSQMYVDNNGKPAYRVRPRYNSEYVWNMNALKKIGADQPDYHTLECWFSQP